MSDTKKYEDDPRPECKYSSKCYQKNPDHHKKFKHPPVKYFGIFNRTPKTKRDDKDSSHSGNDDNKRQKIEESNSKSKKESSSQQSSPAKLEEVASKPENKHDSEKTTSLTNKEELKKKIQELFLVNMPEDFYSFWELYNSSDAIESYIKSLNLILVGPFDILRGDLPVIENQEDYLVHWRYFYDPPEFQTVLASTKNDFHLGYYRDSPSDMPSFVASNDGKNCKIVPMGDNLFSALLLHAKSVQEKIFSFGPKTLHNDFVKAATDWAQSRDFSLDEKTSRMKTRQKNVVAATFHNAGILVPYNKKTQIGYRRLIESDANIKKILTKLSECDTEELKNSAKASLLPIITMANIATDECDFGTGLELGIDFFCWGDTSLHMSVLNLMCTAYEMLNREAFGKIIKVHLKHRRKGSNLSVANLSK